ncbi:hypothetical protein [uncultured Bacteroides sp.]|uniref:hypothetical protein n=1 Tax=uncultured Bacteroides sp. TaxID=162156 RepID=UPI002AAB75B3|nr:hypothetical protein [uncultured Bacteroides sp.]
MIKLYSKDVISIYDRVKRDALKFFMSEKYITSLHSVKVVSQLGYFINHIFTDLELENLLEQISLRLLKKDNRKTTQKKIVLIDSFTLPNRGLTQQYLRALISMNIEFLFIAEGYNDSSKSIFEEIEQSEFGNLYLVPDGGIKEKITYIYDHIFEFSPSDILAHIYPNSVEVIIALYAFPDVNKFNINLTDHAFWIGSKCFDYTLEFRNYGCSLSLHRRGFKKEQIILNPYYPIIANSHFRGLPNVYQNKTVILTGGSYYKMLNKENTFFTLLKNIVENNQDVIVLIAGSGSFSEQKYITNFIYKNNLEDSLILLGDRSDIDKVFEFCDIYVGTYPFGGGLMTQYAATKGKPIVSLIKSENRNSLEELVFGASQPTVQISFFDEKLLMKEITKLIIDVNYRREQGDKLKENMTTAQIFNARFSDIINLKKKIPINFQNVDIMEEHLFSLETINVSNDLFGFFLYKYFKIHLFYISPKIAIKYFPPVMRLIFYKVKQILISELKH